MTRTERLATHIQNELERTHGVDINYAIVLETVKEHLKDHKLCLAKIREIGD